MVKWDFTTGIHPEIATIPLIQTYQWRDALFCLQCTWRKSIVFRYHISMSKESKNFFLSFFHKSYPSLKDLKATYSLDLYTVVQRFLFSKQSKLGLLQTFCLPLISFPSFLLALALLFWSLQLMMRFKGRYFQGLSINFFRHCQSSL